MLKSVPTYLRAYLWSVYVCIYIYMCVYVLFLYYTFTDPTMSCYLLSNIIHDTDNVNDDK